MSQPLKTLVSIVNYANTLPFKWALKRSKLAQQIDLQEDIPSICAQKLKFRQVDLALVPVALIPELENYFIESDYCIGATGKVDSVKLYSLVPIERITDVALDYQSRTSVNLSKVLFKFFWKREVRYTETTPGYEKLIEGTKAVVVIGDRTFSMNDKFPYEYDLSEEWQKFTGLPFVFAVWLSVEKIPVEFINEFNAVLKFGLEHIDLVLNQEALPSDIPKTQLKAYLENYIDYNLNDQKRTALSVFLEYLKKI